MRASQGQRPATSGTFGAWSPANVPQVAAGYWWTAADATGIGTAGFKVPEGGAHTTFDLIQAVVANQPTVLTELGGTQFRHRTTGDNPVSLTSLPAAAGWTGSTYMGMWLRLPVDLTGTNNIFQHNTPAPGARLSILTLNGTPDVLRINLISGAQAFTGSNFPTPFADLGWHWIECVFDPGLTLGGGTNADFAKMFRDLVAVVPAVTAAHPTAIADVASAIRMSNSSGGVANNADVTDWCAVYYANGIPSLANREALRRLLAPV